MITREALTALSNSLFGRRVLSVYIDGRATDPAARLAWRSTLAHNLAAVAVNIGENADDRRDFARCRALLEEWLAPIHGSLSAPGFVAFVTSDQIALAETLPVAMPNVARWQKGPWISPYIRAQKELRPVILAIVDARSARTHRYALGVISPLERFHAHVQTDQPTHMGRASRPAFHTGTRGATATDAIDRAQQHGTQRMLKELIEHIMSVTQADEWIVIGGMTTAAGLVLSMLPTTARQRAVVVQGLSATTPTSMLRRAAREHGRRLRQRLDGDLVEMAITHAGDRGRGSVGEEITRAALKISDVHLLLMSTAFLNDRPEVAEELARLALAGGSAIEVVSHPAAERLDHAGGVAAILRYVATDASAAADEVPLTQLGSSA